MSATTEMEPWQWPEAHWRGIVDHVRAGRALQPTPGRTARVARSRFSFDSDHETNELRDGGGSIGKLSQGQYGNRQGVPRILDILGRHGVPASFYVPAVAALLYPDEQRRVVAEGHEVGIHGWIHERNSVLPLDAERDLQMRAADTLEKITGVRPVGIRTPSWDFSPNTLAITRDMGLEYDSSLMADVDCYELLLDGEPTGVVELPVEWIRDDAVYFNMNRFAGLRPLHAAVRRARHLPPRVRHGLGAKAAYSSSPCTRTSVRLPLAGLDPGGADPPRQGARQRLVRHPRRHRPFRARQRAIAGTARAQLLDGKTKLGMHFSSLISRTKPDALYPPIGGTIICGCAPTQQPGGRP